MTTASVYTGFRLADSGTKLLLAAARRGGMEPFEVRKGTHITLKFRGNPESLPVEMLGTEFCFRILGIREESGIQTVMVEPIEESVKALKWASPPHITLAHREGVKSSTSKKLARDWQEFGPRDGDLTFGEDFTLYARLGFFHDRKKWTFHLLPEAEMVPTLRTV